MKRKFSEKMVETLIYLPPALVKEFNRACKELEISKSAFARTSIQHFIDMYRIKCAGLSGDLPDNDVDNFDYSKIAEAYLRYETNWRK
jgi:hypothetical protein